MTETTDAAETAVDASAEQTSEYTPPASQADLDRIVSERLARQKAQFKDYDELKAAKAEAERQAEELARWQTEAEAWRKTAVGSRIEALAAHSFADPTDAVSALADKSFIDAGGQLDEAAIKAELAALLERKPHWARQGDNTAPPRRLPAPNGAQGSSGGAPPADPAAQFASILQSQLGSP